MYKIDPLTDSRWNELLQSHPQASIFHTRAWLGALQETYGYVPMAVTTSPPGEKLLCGLPACEVKSLFGRSRLVSLPFTDHCVPLVEEHGQLDYLLRSLRQRVAEGEYSKIELRFTGDQAAARHYRVDDTDRVLHILDLTSGPEAIFQNLHRDCIQRKIRRAVREGVTYESGTSESLLQEFYRLLLSTRRRHGLPPQPIAWFRNLIAGLGSDLRINVAYLRGKAIAAIVVLSHKTALTYKYGASDRASASVGAMQLLLWKAIEHGCRDGMTSFDMGRSEVDGSGLATFKDRWGAVRISLQYCSCPAHTEHRGLKPIMNLGKYVFSQLPDPMLAAAGRFFYRYAG